MPTLEQLHQLYKDLLKLIEDLTKRLREHNHGGFETIKLDDGFRDILMSFETGETTVTPIYFPFAVRITMLRGVVMKAIAATDNATVVGSVGGVASSSDSSKLTFTASDPVNTEEFVMPLDNEKVGKGEPYVLTSAKTTAGGKALITVEWERI